MDNKNDKDIQVDDSNTSIVNFDLEEFKNKKKNLESLLGKIGEISGAVKKCIEETEEEIRITDALKKSNIEKQIYKQRNIDLREENNYMKEYLKLREENDELELSIMEMEMKKKHRISYLENRYLINIPQIQMQPQLLPQLKPQPQQQSQSQPQQQPQPQPQPQIQASVVQSAPPPPPPPPANKRDDIKAPPASHSVNPTNINDEIKTLLTNKFRNANPDL